MRRLNNLPTEFRGCIWDEGWEFDAPCILYYPVKRYTPFAGNSGGVDCLVEGLCCDISLHGIKKIDCGFTKSELRELKLRGWGLRFDRRRNARHVRIRGKWRKEDGDIYFYVTSRKERTGPFPWEAKKKLKYD